ncbi:acyl-CoA carboxylate CoA-transferase [Histoplasma capsulatum]|uniref:Acyl-CoA carboxylate CoA-transferase n=1 Tax=Ajellomyces capsulatus TaxID=5037 RepID=A0A8A1MIA6_AJECA|nr:acyl-CoA carboxylate CoA-transferase [Histoplasma capsulatum]
MAVSAVLKSRIRRPSMLSKLARAEDLISLFPNGSYIGWSGFTGVGYPNTGKYPPLWQITLRRIHFKDS